MIKEKGRIKRKRVRRKVDNKEKERLVRKM